MSRRTEKRRYGKYNKFDVVYADFGKNPHGIQGGIRHRRNTNKYGEK